MAVPIWFIAVKKFGPEQPQPWADYVAWAKLPQLRELISLDIMLCPPALTEFTDEDWQHNVQADYLIDFFLDWEYLLTRLAADWPAHVNILAAMREPGQPGPELWRHPRFCFAGYDLIEQPGGGISALTNCGGFDLAFQPSDLSPSGLLADFELAQAVQTRLRTHYPHEDHADCALWALWRLAPV